MKVIYAAKPNPYVWHYFFPMVNFVEDAVSLDRLCRLVLPSSIREVLELKGGGLVFLRLDGSRVILEPISKNLKEKVQEWVNLALSLKAEILTEESRENWKWMSREL